MIISRTPFRVSFVGGGTDLPAFYEYEPGAVLSSAVDKYMFITVNRRFDDTIRISYRKTEIVGSREEIEHPIVRACLEYTDLGRGLEITSMADLPAGSGMGSSSSFTVGLLNALWAWKGRHVSAEELAKQACEIEIDILKEPIGRQDQYAAAFGGLNTIRFNADHSVFTNPVIVQRGTLEALNQHLLMFYTGQTRSASSILSEQSKATIDRMSILRQMRDQVDELAGVLIDGSRLDRFGEMLHEGWLLKRQITGGITNPDIDAAYDRALSAGALGGKLLGAGGGGFLLFYVAPHKQNQVSRSLGLRRLELRFEPQGSKIIYVH
jgi:D-glycero-alpha-D-manno-heptose-7-phosphate kinase